MSEIKTEILFKNIPDDSPEEVAAFFRPLGEVEVETFDQHVKSDLTLVNIVLTIAGTWAAERFILDPLADKAKIWWESVSPLEYKNFKIEVIFSEDGVTFETIKFSNPLILAQLWKILKLSSDLIAMHQMQTEINRILILPYKPKTPLIIGCRNHKPKYIIDIDSKNILPIMPSQDEDVEREFWKMEQTASRLDDMHKYSKAHSPKAIKKEENEISKMLSKWTAR